ncbi:MAG: glycosyltransferase family 4 protein [Candidatus Eremiobacteraeota bacterium]|nr:glycosyltransferase family 4 protein [Candidatus Eremiobacteraeota bacterium]MBV9646476.1 glycosyltransferase family 4 protein [Candidatus Eremiobacteraeota bacterium]
MTPGKTAVIVTNQVPGHDIGLQQSGHARYLTAFIEHFAGRGLDVVLAVPRPHVDFTSISYNALPFRLRSPRLVSVGERLVLRSARARAAVAAWRCYCRMPRALQSFAASVRLQARRCRGYVHRLGTFLTQEDARFVDAVVAQERPAIVLYDGIFNWVQPTTAAPAWLITHEIKHLRAESFAAQGAAVLPRELTRQRECATFNKARNLIAIQWDDAQKLRALAPAARVVVVPVPADVPSSFRRAPIEGRCLFVGSGSYHNVDAINWFLDEVWARLRGAYPHATLDVVGTVAQRIARIPAGVRVHGNIEHLDAVYREASLAIIPLRIGSGLKVKTVEALAYGLPTLTTSVGAQGLMHLCPPPFIVEDDPARFAARAAYLLRVPSERAVLEHRARSCAQRFTPMAAFAEFRAATSAVEAA